MNKINKYLCHQSTFLFRQRLFFILPLPFLSRIGCFLLCFVFILQGTSFWFVLFSSDGALTFFIFVLLLIMKLSFRFLVFLGRVNVGGVVDLDGWLEVRLITTAAVGNWSVVRWVEAAGDWLAGHWLAGEEDCLAGRWLAGEGGWLEVRWVAREGDW